MALKAMVMTLDGVDEAAKPLYKQLGNVFVLDVEPVEGYALENITGLKSAVQREREQREAAEHTLKSYEGLDAAKAREALAKVEAMSKWTPDDKVNEMIEQRTKALAAAKDAEADALKQQLAKYRTSYEAVTIEGALKDAAAKHKFLQPALAPKLFRDAVMLHETAAGLVPVVKGADGKPVQVVGNDGSMRFKTIDEYVAEQAASELYAPLVAGKGATGTAGAKPPEQNNNGAYTPPRTAAAVLREVLP